MGNTRTRTRQTYRGKRERVQSFVQTCSQAAPSFKAQRTAARWHPAARTREKATTSAPAPRIFPRSFPRPFKFAEMTWDSVYISICAYYGLSFYLYPYLTITFYSARTKACYIDNETRSKLVNSSALTRFRSLTGALISIMRLGIKSFVPLQSRRNNCRSADSCPCTLREKSTRKLFIYFYLYNTVLRQRFIYRGTSEGDTKGAGSARTEQSRGFANCAIGAASLRRVAEGVARALSHRIIRRPPRKRPTTLVVGGEKGKVYGDKNRSICRFSLPLSRGE